MEESLHRSILASGAIMCRVRSARCTAGPVCRCVYTQMCAHMVHRHMYMNVQVCVWVWVPSTLTLRNTQWGVVSGGAIEQ